MRDLEIALVLAREMKAAAARSVDASLRLDQLQEVFGVERLDQAERARIQTALQMAGLEPFPSLLQADPTEPIRFGAAQAAVTAEREIPADPAEAAPAAEPPAAAEARPTFPTVGEFARSKLGGRSRPRFGLRRRDHFDGDSAPPPPPPPLAEESNGRLPEPEGPDDGATAIHAIPQPEVEDEPLVDEPVAGEAEDELVVEEVADAAPVAEPEEELAVAEPEEELAVEEPEEEPAVEEPEEEPAVEEPEEDLADEVPHDELSVAVPHEEPEVEDRHEEPEVEDRHEEPEVEDHPAAHDEREYIPLVPQQPAAAEPLPPEPQPVGARAEDVVAVLLPAVAIPVIVTSIAGWRFGLPFVALSVVATGWLLSRHGGVSKAWRRSPAAGTILKTTAAVTALSVVAALALASVGKNSTKSDKAGAPALKKPAQPSTASKPATTTPATAPSKKPHKKKPAASKPNKPTQSTPSQPSSAPPPDPATQGLIRVPPSQAAQTPTTPSAQSPGTTTQPSP